ncbi:hypothetical protein FB570_111190 [Streptomyces sp. T12]|nr:hypothetical protein FB570_111190 [Streptomyces sp. T12]
MFTALALLLSYRFLPLDMARRPWPYGPLPQPAQAVPRGSNPLRQARGPLPDRTASCLADPPALRAHVSNRSTPRWQEGEHTRRDPQLTQSGQERCSLFLRDLSPQGRSRIAGAEDQPAVPPAFGVDRVGRQVRQHLELPVVSDVKVDPHPRIGAPGPRTTHDLLPSQRQHTLIRVQDLGRPGVTAVGVDVGCVDAPTQHVKHFAMNTHNVRGANSLREYELVDPDAILTDHMQDLPTGQLADSTVR